MGSICGRTTRCSGLSRWVFTSLAVLAFSTFGDLRAQEITAQPDFAGTKVCRDCHEQEYQAWSGSHHDWALKHPTPETVLGNFDEAVFEGGDVRMRFFRKDDGFLVETSEPVDGVSVFEIKFAVGVEPLQQYVVELDGGQLQTLDIAWDTVGERWFDLYPEDKSKPGDGFHWSGPYKNWQARCAVCHQTGFEKNYDLRERTYKSEWKDLTVGCEACHGAGASHVAWARNPQQFENDAVSGVDARGLLVNFLAGREGQKTEIDSCAGCHSRREAFDANSPPAAADFNDHYNIATLRGDLYHDDGQIDAEVYVYGSFLQSKMFAKGVKCSNCHEPHSARLKADGNAVCTQCHNESGREDFTSLKPAVYDSPDHHRHPSGSEGAQCVSCHMPSKNFMIVDPRRDHSFRVPRPDLSVTLGTPNACSACHSDKPAKWAAKTVKDWYPDGRSGAPHFAEALHRARTFPSENSSKGLVDIALDETAAVIVRATAIAELRARMSADVAKALVPLLKHSEPMIRVNAVRAFESAPAAMRGSVIAAMMADPVRAVRLAAARATMNISPQGLEPDALKIVKDAREDFRSGLVGRFDFPETHMQMAGLAMSGRNFRNADAAFAEALRQDPQLINAWTTRSRIAMALRQPQQAEAILTEALQKNPDSAPLYQSLAAVYVQTGRLPDALKSLGKAKGLSPGDPVTRLDIARIQSEIGNRQAAIQELEGMRASGLSTADALELLAASYVQIGDVNKAVEITRELRTNHPLHTPQLKEVRALWEVK